MPHASRNSGPHHEPLPPGIDILFELYNRWHQEPDDECTENYRAFNVAVDKALVMSGLQPDSAYANMLVIGIEEVSGNTEQHEVAAGILNEAIYELHAGTHPKAVIAENFSKLFPYLYAQTNENDIFKIRRLKARAETTEIIKSIGFLAHYLVSYQIQRDKLSKIIEQTAYNVN